MVSFGVVLFQKIAPTNNIISTNIRFHSSETKKKKKISDIACLYEFDEIYKTLTKI